METIQIQITEELAQQLRSYTNELPRLLELGLRLIKDGGVAQPVTQVEPTSLSVQEQAIRVLRKAGATGPDAKSIAQYLAKPIVTNWQPIRAGGKPASAMIIEERKSRSWNKT
jgi:hypothetical protein